MKLRNIGTKIVNVESVILMPGDEMDINDVQATYPSINTLCGMGMLIMLPDPVAVAPVVEQVEAEQPVEEKRVRRARAEKTE